MGVKVWRELCEISAMSEIAVDSRLGRAGGVRVRTILSAGERLVAQGLPAAALSMRAGKQVATPRLRFRVQSSEFRVRYPNKFIGCWDSIGTLRLLPSDEGRCLRPPRAEGCDFW